MSHLVGRSQVTIVKTRHEREMNSDGRDYSESRSLHALAKEVFPAGVNSAIRAGELPVPLSFSHGFGSRVVDVDGNEYIDFQLGQGALFLGHAHEGLSAAMRRQLDRGTHYAGQSEIELSAGQLLLDAVQSLQQVRFANSATEAVIAALRLARAATGRQRVVRFEGHYHGWSDEGLAGFAPQPTDWLDDHYSLPSHPSAGVLREAVEQFHVARFNDAVGLRDLVERDASNIAAIIFEPVMCNTGCIAPNDEFVAELLVARERSGCLLIADETITGIRFGRGGAQERFGIDPDLTILGKAMGGGVPVAAFGGTAELMDLIATGYVNHAGTLNGNPLCMAAVEYVLSHVSDSAVVAAETNAIQLATRLKALAAEANFPLLVQQVGPVIFTAVSQAGQVQDYRDVLDKCRVETWATLRRSLLQEGVRVLERGLWYLSLAHTPDDLDETCQAFARALETTRDAIRTSPVLS
jgi:glutamate-1-semialdehyde 2,1-aminomutase